MHDKGEKEKMSENGHCRGPLTLYRVTQRRRVRREEVENVQNEHFSKEGANGAALFNLLWVESFDPLPS